MLYSIEGFSQEQALKFRRVETVRRKNPKTGAYEDKEALVALDCTDLVILRWLIKFWPNMVKVEINGSQYAWLSYKDAMRDLPILNVQKKAFALRLKKMVDFGILSHRTVKNGGTFSYYGLGPEYMRLVDSEHARKDSDQGDEQGIQNFGQGIQNFGEGVQNFGQGVSKILDNKNPNTKYNPKTKDQERKKTDETFDSIIDGFTQDQGLRDALRGFLQYRVASSRKGGKAFTNHALKLNLSKLSKLSSDPAEMVEIVNQTVERGWSGFFELKKDDHNQLGTAKDGGARNAQYVSYAN